VVGKIQFAQVRVRAGSCAHNAHNEQKQLDYGIREIMANLSGLSCYTGHVDVDTSPFGEHKQYTTDALPYDLKGSPGFIDDPFGFRTQVRTTPSWPRSWANFSVLQPYSRRNAWANWHRLGQPDTFRAARTTGRPRTPCSYHGPNPP
jgi:hypothetical protein